MKRTKPKVREIKKVNKRKFNTKFTHLQVAWVRMTPNECYYFVSPAEIYIMDEQVALLYLIEHGDGQILRTYLDVETECGTYRLRLRFR